MAQDLLIPLLGALAFAAVMMLAVWAASVRLNNAGIVDVAWSGGFAALSLLYFVMTPGYLPRKLLLTALVCIWSVRLAAYILMRIVREHPHEDPRYNELRRKWGDKATSMFCGFFQIQGLTLALLSAPFLLIDLNARPAIAPIELAGVAVWLLGVVGEATADFQLQQFKADPANQGKVCQVGLWNWSRHPNYFFEWVIWCSYFLIALAAPWGVATIYCPILMYHFLVNVTGIPPAEQRSLLSRADAYREYQRTTSPFFPWFKRS